MQTTKFNLTWTSTKDEISVMLQCDEKTYESCVSLGEINPLQAVEILMKQVTRKMNLMRHPVCPRTSDFVKYLRATAAGKLMEFVPSDK